MVAFCERRVPPEVRDQINLEFAVRGNSVTIIERRPPWREDFGPEWSSMKIAQLRFDEVTRAWSLWWPVRNGHWNPYLDLSPTPEIEVLLQEINDDPTAIFWG